MSSEFMEVDWLSRWDSYSPQKIALEDYKNKKEYSYKQLFSESKKLAKFLENLDVKFGDRVASLSHNRVETVLLFFALQRLGAILVPINFRLSPSEIEYILQDCGAKILFYDTGFSEAVKKIISDRLHMANPKSNESLTCLPYEDFEKAKELEEYHNFEGTFETPSMILYTSGTTGFPKGAVLTHKMLFWNSVNTSLSLKITEDDVTINFAPLFHTGGWNVLMTPFFHRGAKVIFFDKFDADEILKVGSERKVTLLFGVPTMLTLMSQSTHFKTCDLKSLRYMVVGGEPMPLSLIKTWHDKGVPVRQGFGLTEFGPNCFSLSAEDAETKMGSIGRPNFYVKTKIVDAEKNEVPVGDVGELLLSGPSCMHSYWNNEKATAQALQDGWLFTGDLVRKDEDDYFYVVGRKKEMFISGGENVYPIEVERILQTHPKIHEVAVIGVPDEQWGEVGHAFVSVKSEENTSAASSRLLSPEELKSFCKNNLAGYKIPKHFSFVEELPKGDSGKINKKVLKTMKVDVQASL